MMVGATEDGLVVGDTEGREDQGDTTRVLTVGDTVGMVEDGLVVGAEVGVCDSVPHIKHIKA
jgi:hypothetical protein